MSSNVETTYKILDSYSLPELSNLYWLSLSPQRQPEQLQEGKDYVVYLNHPVTLTLPSGSSTKLRDLIVFGTLTIKGNRNEAPLPHLEVRNILQIGNLYIDHLDLTGKHANFSGDYVSFQTELLRRINESYNQSVPASSPRSF